MFPAQATVVQAGVPHSTPPLPQPNAKKKKRAAHLMPKLTVENFSEASFQEAIKVGRKAKARGKPREGREAKALGELLRNMSTWAKEVAPQYSFAEFMFASQALGTNRSLRPMVANLRLAEFREVNAEFEAPPADDIVANSSERGGQVMADAPPDELEALVFDDPSGDQWEEEDVMMDGMEMEMHIMRSRRDELPNTKDNTDSVQERRADEAQERRADTVQERTEDAAQERTEDAAQERTGDAAQERTEDAAQERTEDGAQERTEDAAQELTADVAQEPAADAVV
ncbi:chromosome segregation in meiosis protein [Gracilaria domingensis]|nr:chromosome segregation in meiosis protein [Gracilaria domingensis]